MLKILDRAVWTFFFLSSLLVLLAMVFTDFVPSPAWTATAAFAALGYISIDHVFGDVDE